MSKQADNDSTDLIKVHDLHFAYGERPVFSDLNLQIPRGKVSVIMGPSGCGKSTLLSFIGGRLVPDRGEVEVDGEIVAGLSLHELYQLRRRMGMLFQNSALLTDLTVFENVAYPLREHSKLAPGLINSLVLMKLELVGLRGAASLMPAELSGGMARRVAFARAIALDPMLVMYDEPFAGLDPISMGMVMKLIRELNQSLGLTSLVVTHDVIEACEIADYMFLLGRGQVLAEGTPEQLQQSDVAEVKQFMFGLPDGPVPFHYPAGDYHQALEQGS